MSSRLVKLAILSLALFGASVAAQTTTAPATTAPATTAPATTAPATTAPATTAPATTAPATTAPATTAPATTAPAPVTPAPTPRPTYGAGSRISTVPLNQEFTTVNKVINKDVFALIEAQIQGYTDPENLPTGFYGNGAAYEPAQLPYDGKSAFVAPNPSTNANYNPNFVWHVNGRTYSSVGQLLSTNAAPGHLYTNPVPVINYAPYVAPEQETASRRRVLRL